MADKQVVWTQVPVVPDGIYLEVYPTFDAQGVYVRHEVRGIYQVKDSVGGKRHRPEVNPVPLTAGQRTTLASFIGVIVAHANTAEET